MFAFSRPACAAIVLLLAAAPALAAPGAIDGTFAGFGSGGSVPLSGTFTRQAVGADGKLVLLASGGGTFTLERLLVGGNPDPSFGANGRVTINPAVSVVALDVAVQADGKVVVSGGTDIQTPDVFVLRVTRTGALDGTFGTGGMFRFPVPNDFVRNLGARILIQPDGKLLVGGTTFVGGDEDFFVARVSAAGTLDLAFGVAGNGRAVLAFGANDSFGDMALQGDGKIVVGGVTSGALDDDFAVGRLNANGTPDAGFDGDGKVQTGFGGLDFVDVVAIQPDGKILAAGGNRMARYSGLNGALDGTFDGDGKLNVAEHVISGMVALANGKILLGADHELSDEAEITRLNGNGTLDTSFKGTGRLVLVGGSLHTPPLLHVLADGRMLTSLSVGSACTVSRFWPDGAPDAGGLQTAAFGDAAFPAGSNEVAYGMALSPDGKVVLAGEVATHAGTETDVALQRLDAEGQLDLTFGVLGRASLSINNYDTAKAIVRQTDGKLVVAGSTGASGPANFLIARFNVDGTPDNTFGFAGFNIVDFAGGNDYGNAIALAPDGKIVVAGTVSNGARNVYGVARFTTDGVLDNTFNGTGKSTHEIAIGPNHWCTSVLVQADNKIVIGGYFGTDFALARFLETGGPDAGFGTGGGHVVTNMGGNDYLNALAQGTTGLIYAAGARETSGHTVFAVARYSANGVLFSGCNTHGCTTWPLGMAFFDWGAAVNGVAQAIDVRSDGAIAIGGCVGTGVGWIQLTNTKSTASASGTADFAGTDECATAVRFVNANRLLVGGFQDYDADHNMGLARFETTTNALIGVADAPPPRLELANAFPNPATATATFAFALPGAGHASLALYDVAGRRVRTLVDETLAAGSHQRTWNREDDRGTPVAPGVYFARLDAGGASARRTIVVVR